MKIYTIGFTKKRAGDFFEILGSSGVKSLTDIRLNNISQLSGFAKRDDLKFFLKTICDIEYRHAIELAPTKSMLDAYKKGMVGWSEYAENYVDLIHERQVEKALSPQDFENTVLLCSESTPDNCHRRLAAEYLSATWSGVDIVHL